MKKLNKTHLLIASIMLVFSINSNAQILKAEIKAAGLTCSMCSNAINKQLKTMPEVASVATDLNANTFIVTLIAGNNLSPKIFKEKVEKAGFSIGSLVVTTKRETIAKNNYILVNDKKTEANEVKFQVVDQGYVTAKEYKKLAKLYKNMATYLANNDDDFHIKITN